jgi:large subunit ribosomal protein L20
MMNHDKILRLAKGFRGRAKNCIRIARERVEKALQHSYRDRKEKKREMRGLWIQRINAGTRQYGVSTGLGCNHLSGASFGVLSIPYLHKVLLT